MSTPLILVIDDETNIADLAKMYLTKEGFEVITAEDGDEGLQLFRSRNPTLIVLDLMLPGVDGWEITRQIRKDSNVPIIMLTARSEDVDRIVGLELGADDYLTKPFNPRELVARVKAVLRRYTAMPAVEDNHSDKNRIIVGDIVIDLRQHTVEIAGRNVELRAKEFELLTTFAQSPNSVFDREKLLNQVWGYEYYGDSRTIDVHITHLREKLEGSQVKIQTVWGVGYKLVVQ
ncbi:MAG: response regulator transcription factor [Chloroflexi bacterium]|uniref:Response regulator transcription factor n=1 Tax=Candidatus Chlorohelix allophototropha TaxID=3003348 RepID=A0A8T7LYT1_9CHLR|nr:response regulator transcription factor [Chloroflexota bacterium]WJW66528.1 response regulator transcription factor [Chloroflexota bacterium L227-S17]